MLLIIANEAFANPILRKDEEFTIRIVHTNDMHARYLGILTIIMYISLCILILQLSHDKDFKFIDWLQDGEIRQFLAANQ